MRALPDAEFNKLKASQAESMQDVCHIQRVTLVSGSHGWSEQLAYYASGTTCSFQYILGNLRETDQLLVVDYDAMMRIPSAVEVRLNDRVTLVTKGNTMVSGTFAPHGQPIVNEMVQYVKLKQVST